MDFYKFIVYGVLFNLFKFIKGNASSNFLESSWEYLKCPVGDCCSDFWIPQNISKLKLLLKEEVFGQHIASDMVARQLEAHLSNPSPSKPLVMSFHGWTGNGKNHVAYLIAKSLYRQELKSSHYHHFMATVHFPDQEYTKLYQDQVRAWVKGNVTACPRSLFVFDEVDKMPPGVLDGIKAYLDYIERVDNVDYRKAIFIFLSNTGGKEITHKVHETWLAGRKKRGDLTINDFERLIELGAFNEQGSGLHLSHLIEKSLIDVFVPFLPLEKYHVRLCAENEFKKQNFILKSKEATLQKIVDELNYFPDDKELYSTTGCKRVAQKVSLYIADVRFSETFRHRKNEL